MDDARVHEPRVDKTAAHKGRAWILLDEVALARKKALVHLRRTLDHHGVRRNLIAAAKLYDVVEHDPLKVELAFRAVADNLGLFCGKQSEAVDHALRAERLEDADPGVEHHDGEEGKVLPRPRDDNEDGKDDVDKIEEGKEVLEHKFAHRLGLELHIEVDLAALYALGHLGGGEPMQALGCIVCHEPSPACG